MKIVTGEVRFSYANLFEPRKSKFNDKVEYSLMILIPKRDTKTVDSIQRAIDDAAERKWGKNIPRGMKSPLRDGDDYYDENGNKKGEPYSGHWFMNLTSKSKPGVIDRNKQEILDPSDLISGDYGRVSMNSNAYDVSGSKGIKFYLNNVQKLRNGEPLSAQSRAEDDFGDWSDSVSEFG